MNKETRIIKGHEKLELVVGNIYEINYGINQGLYKYKGVIEKNDGHEWWVGASLFENINTGQSFCYYGTNSPYEFTRIISDTRKYPDSYMNHIKEYYKNYESRA